MMWRTFLLALSLSFSLATYSQNDMWDVCPIKVGQEIPNSKLLSMDGDSVLMQDVIKNDKIVLVFFRGAWCPYCTKHLKALQEVKSDMDKLNYRLVAVTVDNVANTSELISKKDLDYELYTDVNGQTIDDFGISFQLPEKTLKKYKNSYGIDLAEKSSGGHTKLPVPAVFIIDKGKVKYQYVNPDYSQRLEPKMLLQMLK